MMLRKFNQEHDPQTGQFTGPGGSHDPTGNPVGRPRQTDYGKEPIGRSLSVAGGGIAGNVAGEALGGAAGAAVGSVVPIVGTAAGELAGQWLGGLAGDYVGSKIGATLYDLKRQMDGHPVGVGHIGELTPGDRAAMVGSYLGGTASWLAFGSRAGAAGARLASRYGARPGSFGARIGTAAGKTVADEAGAAVGSLAGRGVHAAGEEGSKVKKGYDGSFASMVPQALPQLFGPKQWAEIEGTPFAGYVRARVRETAGKLDDRGAQLGLPTTPSRRTAELFAAYYAAAGHVAGAQPAVVDPRVAAMSSAPLAKALTLPLISPNDVVSRDAQQTGGAANVRFLRMMQEADRKSRATQQTRAFTGPRVENLAMQPGEDEQQYRKRLQQVMAQSVRGSPLFNGGESTLYRVRLNKRRDDAKFTINAELAKGLNTEDRLKQGLVYGWASVIEKDGEIVTDHQGDRITPDELVKAAHDFICNSRKGGVLHDEYGHKIGHIVESVVFTKELQDHLGIDLGKVGWLIGYQITDPRVKTLIKSGMLKAFSIGGRGRREAA